MARTVRLAAVSYVPPAHDHHRRGVDLAGLREVVLKVAKDRPDFICFPEACACVGGQLLQHWALRYGFTVVVALLAESAVIDMAGRYLVRQGRETHQVRAGRLPPWAVAEVNLDREVFHLDYNQDRFPAIRAKYGPDVDIEVHQPEAFFL